MGCCGGCGGQDAETEKDQDQPEKPAVQVHQPTKDKA